VFLIVEIYPLIFYSTVLGICSLFGIISSILSIEYIQNLPNDIFKLIILLILAVISFGISNYIIEEERKSTYSDIEDTKLICYYRQKSVIS
jgi:divalent metal cation (Fe/Co/Zn/Cd) transporter